VAQEQFLAYWTTETGWTSELQLRNNTRQNLMVTPALRLPGGAETALAAVTIMPQQVASVDLDSAIAAANAPQLVGAWGSVVLRYSSPTAASLYAAMMLRRPGHPIALHVDAAGQWQTVQAGGREGVWWLPQTTASDYLILTNRGDNAIPLSLSIYDAAGHQNGQSISLPPHQTLRYSMRSLVQSAGFAGSFGGVKISASAYAGSLDTLHFLFDDGAGFSAILKMFDYDPNATMQERDYAATGIWTLRAPMLALSNPDPALGFPAGTTLHPLLFIRNTTAKPLTASLQFNWRTSTASGKVAGPSLQLAPYQTQQIDVAALQTAGTLPPAANWTSVTLVTNSNPDEVVAVAASYDSTLRYGAQTPFSDQLTFEWEGGMWEYDAYHDSIITAGNGGTQPVTVAFRIFYNQGTKSYEVDQTLQPDDQMWIDIGKLIRQQTPDKNGNTLPANLASGSYQVREISNKGAGTLFEGKVIYDKTYGSATYGCALCCGYATSGYGFWYDPLPIPDQGAADQGVQALNECDGGDLEDVSGSFYGSWTTGNSSIATADYYGTHTGVGIGSTTSQSHGDLNSNDVPQRCPLKAYNCSGNDNTNPVPDHLTVVEDQGGYPAACPTTGVYVRQMLMQVIDNNGQADAQNSSVVETLSPNNPTNSCGNGSPIPAACAPTGSTGCSVCGTGQFLDTMTVSLNFCGSGITQGSGCGFSATSTWSACATSGTNQVWVSPRTVHSNGVTVDGRSTSWPPNTVCNTSGC